MVSREKAQQYAAIVAVAIKEVQEQLTAKGKDVDSCTGADREDAAPGSVRSEYQRLVAREVDLSCLLRFLTFGARTVTTIRVGAQFTVGFPDGDEPDTFLCLPRYVPRVNHIPGLPHLVHTDNSLVQGAKIATLGSSFDYLVPITSKTGQQLGSRQLTAKLISVE